MSKITWSEVLAGYGLDVHIASNVSEEGILEVTVNDNVIFSGTQSDAYVTFIGLSKLFGPKTSKQLIKLTCKGERFVRAD